MLVSLQVELTKSLDQIQISIVFLQKANNHFRESSVFRQIGDFSSKANVLVLIVCILNRLKGHYHLLSCQSQGRRRYICKKKKKNNGGGHVNSLAQR